MDVLSFVPAAVSLCVDVLSKPANRGGVAFLGTALALTFGLLAPRKRLREDRCREHEAKFGPLLPHEVITAEDLVFVKKARCLFLETPSPVHSNFLVAACISYVDADGEVRDVVGVNSETCVLPNSICAERCALHQVRC